MEGEIWGVRAFVSVVVGCDGFRGGHLGVVGMPEEGFMYCIW